MPDIDFARVKGNLRKMIEKGASEAETEAYLATEGVTADQVRAAPDVLASQPAARPQPASEAATGIPAEAWKNAERLRDPAKNPATIGPQSVYSRPPTMALDDPRRSAMIATQAASSGLGSVPALPADLGALALNIPLIALDNAAHYGFGSDIFSTRVPVLSAEVSERVGDSGRALGIPFIPRNEMTQKERLAYDATEAVSNGLGLGAFFKALAKKSAGTVAGDVLPKTPAAAAEPVFTTPADRFVARMEPVADGALTRLDPPSGLPGHFHEYKQPYMLGEPQAVMAGDAVSNASGAALSNFVGENIPESWNEATRGALGLGAGLGAAKVGNIGGRGITNFAINGPAAAAETVSRAFNPYDKTIPVDPQSLTAVFKSTADQAAEVLQGRVLNAGEDPKQVAQQTLTNLQAYQEAGLPTPTAAPLSGSVGMQEIEGGRRGLNTGAFAARDNELRQAGAEAVGQLGPVSRDNPGASAIERDAAAVPFVQAVEAEAARRNAEAQAALDAANKQAEALAAERNATAADLAASKDNRPATAAQREIGQMAIDTRNSENATSNALYNNPALKNAEVVPETAVTKAQDIREAATPLNPVPSEVAPFLNRIDTLMTPEEKIAPSIIATDRFGNEIPAPTKPAEVQAAKVNELQKLSNDIDAAIERAKIEVKGAGVISPLIELKKSVDDYKASLTGEAGDALAAAEKNFRERTMLFRQGVGGDIDLALRRDTTGTSTRPVDIGRMLTETPEDVSDLRKIAALGGNEAVTEKGIREIVMNSLASVNVLRNMGDGKVAIDANTLRAWMQKNADYLESAPKVRDEIMSLLRKSEGHEALAGQYKAGIEAAQQNLKLTQEQTNSGAFALVVGKSPSVAAASLFARSGNPPENAAQLMAVVKGNKAAEDGLKQAVADYILRRVSGTQATSPNGALSIADGEAQRAVNLSSLIKFMNEPDTMNIMSKIYTPEEMQNLRRARMALEPLALTYAKATVGSPTAERLNQMLRTMEGGLRASFGAVQGGSIMRSVRLLVGAVNEPGARSLDRLMERAILEPEVAAALLARDLKKDSPLYSAAAQKLVRKQREAAKQFGPEDGQAAEPEQTDELRP